jgi:hypothetical protein
LSIYFSFLAGAGLPSPESQAAAQRRNAVPVHDNAPGALRCVAGGGPRRLARFPPHVQIGAAAAIALRRSGARRSG